MRNGKWIVETGTSLFSGASGGTGGSFLFGDGGTILQFGVEIGKFVSENFTVKGKLDCLISEVGR